MGKPREPVVVGGTTSESGIELARRLRSDGQREVAISRGTRRILAATDRGHAVTPAGADARAATL